MALRKFPISFGRTWPLRAGGDQLFPRPSWRLRVRGSQTLIRAGMPDQRLIGETEIGVKGNRPVRYIGHTSVVLWFVNRGAAREFHGSPDAALGAVQRPELRR